MSLEQKLEEMARGIWERGERELPSLRDLAAEHGVSPNTIKKILLQLQGPFRVEARHGKGFFLVDASTPPSAETGHDASSLEFDDEELLAEVEAEFAEFEGSQEWGAHPPASASPEAGDGSEDSADESSAAGEVHTAILGEIPPEVLAKVAVDLSYSPVPEAGRARTSEKGQGRRAVLIVGQLSRIVDPTGAPGARFQLFLEVRQILQSMGIDLVWSSLGSDSRGYLDPREVESFQFQVAALGDSLSGVLLLDPGYGRAQPAWSVVSESVDAPVVWFHSTPLDPRLLPKVPSNCQILEPDWDRAGRTLGDHILREYSPQDVLLLSAPGESLPPHLLAVREGISRNWGSRRVSVLEWTDVFGGRVRPTTFREKASRVVRRMAQDTGLASFDLETYFQAALDQRAQLWCCADDLLALAAIEFFESRRYLEEPMPGIIGFGNHPFALARGLCTVDLSWPSVIERAIEAFTGLGRRNRMPRYLVIPAPSNAHFGGF